MSFSTLSPYRQIAQKLASQFTKAKASGALNSYPSSVEDVVDADTGLRFQLRVCPSLADKRAAGPSASSADDGDEHGGRGGGLPEAKRVKKSDPFEGPHEDSDLFLGKVGQEEGGEKMVGLLNKFSIVDEHFLLVTEAFQSQHTPLHPPHLLHAYHMLLALRQTGKNFICIYNAGPVSGASQPRRHLQFVPFASAQEGQVGEPALSPIEEWGAAADIEREDAPFALTPLPYSHTLIRLPSSLQSTSTSTQTLSDALLMANLTLLNASHTAIWSQPPESRTPGPTGNPPPPPSYNVVLSLDQFAIIPRFKEKCTLPAVEGQGEREMSINALGYAGSLACESEGEKERVKRFGVAKLLQQGGYERYDEKGHAIDAEPVPMDALA